MQIILTVLTTLPDLFTIVIVSMRGILAVGVDRGVTILRTIYLFRGVCLVGLKLRCTLSGSYDSSGWSVCAVKLRTQGLLIITSTRLMRSEKYKYFVFPLYEGQRIDKGDFLVD